MIDPGYELVRLPNGVMSVRSTGDGETMHPIIGPAAEAEQLYAQQLRLAERLAVHDGEFIVWDVGLGAAANAIAVLRATREVVGVPVSDQAPASAAAGPKVGPCVSRSLRLVSFDHMPALLRFGLQYATELGYFGGYERILGELLEAGEVAFQEVELPVNWCLHIGDFPALLARSSRRQEASILPEPGRARHSVRAAGLLADDGTHGVTHPTSQRASVHAEHPISPPHVGCSALPAPHAILFDPYSPAKNPAMWTAPLFADLFKSLDPQHPCSLATYSRSTLIRVALLLAGFFVGAGHASGQKDETTMAANTLALLEEPFDRRWLERARRSDAAEPLWEPVYRRTKLSETTWEKLRMHPQFA